MPGQYDTFRQRMMRRAPVGVFVLMTLLLAVHALNVGRRGQPIVRAEVLDDPAAACHVCGNGICEVASGENNCNCNLDCTGICPYGPPGTCGNGLCDIGEDQLNCFEDCQGTCGTGTCDPGEDASNCPSDCNSCGDGICITGEDTVNCPADCGHVPEVTITEPTNASVFMEGDSVTFTAVAIDQEDGDIGDTLSWDSSLDGTLAAGTDHFSLSTLSVGMHGISASGHDADEHWNGDLICLVIVPDPNLLENPSFENGTGSNATDWQRIGGGVARGCGFPLIAHSGDCLMAFADNGQSHKLYQAIIPATSDPMQYQVSVWVNANQMARRRAFFGVRVFYTDNTREDFGGAIWQGSYAYGWRSKTFVPAKPVAKLYVGVLDFGGDPGAFSVDDFALEIVEPAP